MVKDSTAAAGNGKGTGGVPLMRKDHYKTLGVKKPATAAGGNGKGTGGVPLTGKDHYDQILGVNKAATAGGDGNGKRFAGAKGTDGPGWGGALTFSPTDHSTIKTAVKVTNEYCYEENSGAFEDDGVTFFSTHRTTMKTAVKVTNEYLHKEEETLVYSEDGDKEEAKDIQGDDAELPADEDDGGAEMGDGGGGFGDYDEDAGTGDLDDFLNGDSYYYDVALAGFDNGYDDDGGDGPDDWW